MMNEQMMTPPPIPPEPVAYGKKVCLMALICCALMFGVLAVWWMSYSRERNNEEVAQEIVAQWGRSVYVNGPSVKQHLDSAASIRPTTFISEANVETQSLHRNIYEAEVYTATVKMSGSFRRDSLRQFGDTVAIELGVVTKQIVSLGKLEIGGKPIPWQKSQYFLFANVDIAAMPEVIDFSTDFEIRGSSGIFIKQIGESNTITINGEASNPSFKGAILPIDRHVSREGRFSAKWQDDIAPDGVTYEDYLGFVGTNFLVGVDRYQKVERSLKYSFIIIILTFISVLFVEIMRKQPIPLLNYFLIGAALILFYSLLLSFVELVAFGWAYLIASLMTIGLIAGYMWKMLQSRKLGFSIGALLSLMYLSCYIMLNASTYALLFGSMLLFISLGALMYASLKIKH